MKILEKTVSDVAGSIGIVNLTLPQITRLSQEAKHFILGVLQNANSFSIISSRNQLRVDDINNALIAFNAPPLLGYKHQKKVKMITIPYSKEESLSFVADEKLELDSLSVAELLPYEIVPQFDLSILMKYGRNMKEFPFSDDEYEDDEESVQYGIGVSEKRTKRKEKQLLETLQTSQEQNPEKALSRLQKYFQKTMEYVQSDNSRFDVILEHVKKDRFVGKLLKKYVDFVENFLQTEQNNGKKC